MEFLKLVGCICNVILAVYNFVMKKVLFTGNTFSSKDILKLKSHNIEIISAPSDLQEEELIKQLEECSGYILGGLERATQKVLDSSNLEVIVFLGTGYENFIDTKVATMKGIEVANTPKANAYTVAEHTVAMILDGVKNISFLNNQTKAGAWPRRTTWNLQNKTLGILGMGTIGTYVARTMHKAFDMNVIYFSRSSKKQIESELNAKKVDLDSLFTESDVISIHATLNEETDNMIGINQLSLMKKTAVLVNGAEAKIVNPQDLLTALEDNVFATAVFDAYYEEPSHEAKQDPFGLLALPDNKFINTAHNAYSSIDANLKMNEMAIENLITFYESGHPKYKVN